MRHDQNIMDVSCFEVVDSQREGLGPVDATATVVETAIPENVRV